MNNLTEKQISNPAQDIVLNKLNAAVYNLPVLLAGPGHKSYLIKNLIKKHSYLLS